jgi:hypothetical protein
MCLGSGEGLSLTGNDPTWPRAELGDCWRCRGSGFEPSSQRFSEVNQKVAMDAAVLAMERPFGKKKA